ncbi:unnamed protein product [Mycena citricolor]|uniref:RING-type domain-containing protein n=1 Tax=Mycena citricolor TaxID=2018698 RepID=A0AAD2JU56_9AGAR|nr:unnamed protein product [Mycena citricolor]
MGGYLDALRQSIPEILALPKLSGAFSRVGVLAYKDYSDETELVNWSGWNVPNLSSFVHDLQSTGGGDFPEAAKTALIRALQKVDAKNAQTLVLWYADAPPHHPAFTSHLNDVAEKQAFPEGSTDWVKLCRTAKRRGCTFFCFTPQGLDAQYSSFYVLLSALTGGICVASRAGENDSKTLARLSVGMVMHWMGRSTATFSDILEQSNARLLRYVSPPIEKLTDEGKGARGYLPARVVGSSRDVWLAQKISKLPLGLDHIPIRHSMKESFDPGKRFLDPGETTYQAMVYESLAEIITTNVACLTYNPIFGQLWRAVCRVNNERKAALVNLFSAQVGRIEDVEQKKGLKLWLEESFDQTEEIDKMIQAAASRPAVYLDFDADVRLTRTELLEVSHSCYPGVLKRIGKIFTHLKLVEPGVTLGPNERFVPLSLSVSDVFRTLPHLIVPGTLYPHRAAALTAIVALVTGVPFLADLAKSLLAAFKGKWLDLEVPENISFDCARLLLSAPEGIVLTRQEKRVYEMMRRYRLIEANLDAPVQVKVPWAPAKTRGCGDMKVRCKMCSKFRSVTIMCHDRNNVCGHCSFGDGDSYLEYSDEESCWVECSSMKCRAQYVVDNVAGLRIRPRCHYCRTHISCPWIECSVCTNRVIIPEAYRTTAADKFTCPGCTNGDWASIASQESTVRAINKENGVGWLGMVADVFAGKSAFKLMQASGKAAFGFVPRHRSLSLVLGQKKVFNAADVLAQVEARDSVFLATCSLCFEDVRPDKLVRACGRTGCTQLVDERCLKEWYGGNAPGKLLNLMQFKCPFCRRQPLLKTFMRYNRAAAALSQVKNAFGNRRWLYAWCTDCGSAQRAFERTACSDRELPPMAPGWSCEDCTVSQTINTFGARLVQCPNPSCGMHIDLIDGCNHVVCVCGTHLCFACGEQFESDAIYEHMVQAHGSIFAEVEEELDEY